MTRAAIALLLCLAPLAAGARLRAVRSATHEPPSTWLRQRSVPLDALTPLVANARVVALGDVTHATHEIYAAKQLLVPQLVAAGFRVIAFEAPYTEYKALDEYVLHGRGNPAAALNLPLYWFWDTNEILELIEWARAQNASGLTPPIRIAAVDPTSPRATAAEVVRFLSRVDPAAAQRAELEYSCLRPSYRPSNRCRESIASVRTAMQSQRAVYAQASSEAEVEEILHAARVVEQGERVLAAGLNDRDAPMAENILHLAARARVIVIGHNEHWGRTPYRLDTPALLPSAGSYLAAALGDEYFALGSVLREGTFLAIEYDASGRNGVILPQSMTAPAAGDIGVLLDQAGLDTMIVPLRGPLPSWLTGTHRLRFAGSTVATRGFATLDVEADVAAKFDAVLYVRTSTPTQLRHWPRF